MINAGDLDKDGVTSLLEAYVSATASVVETFCEIRFRHMLDIRRLEDQVKVAMTHPYSSEAVDKLLNEMRGLHRITNSVQTPWILNNGLAKLFKLKINNFKRVDKTSQ